MPGADGQSASPAAPGTETALPITALPLTPELQASPTGAAPKVLGLEPNGSDPKTPQAAAEQKPSQMSMRRDALKGAKAPEAEGVEDATRQADAAVPTLLPAAVLLQQTPQLIEKEPSAVKKQTQDVAAPRGELRRPRLNSRSVQARPR